MLFSEHILRTVLPQAKVIQESCPSRLKASIEVNKVEHDETLFLFDDFENISQQTKFKCAAVVLSFSLYDRFMQNHVRFEACIITVPDVKIALHTIAAHARALVLAPVIAITGSIGKSSVIRFVEQMFQLAKRRVIVLSGTIDAIACDFINYSTESFDYWIVECSISTPGKLLLYASLARPTVAVVTNTGHSRLEEFGSTQEIANEFRLIFSKFTARDIGIINGDNPLLTQVSYSHPVIKFGFKISNHIQGRKITVQSQKTILTLKIYKNKYKVAIPSPHFGATISALAAVAIGKIFDISDTIILSVIQSQTPLQDGFSVAHTKRGLLIKDVHEASPESVKAALLGLENLQVPGLKVVVLGEMEKLGLASPFWHRQIGRFLRKTPSINKVILVGEYGALVQKTAPTGMDITLVSDYTEAYELFARSISSVGCVLAKGSKEQGFDALVNKLQK